MLIIHVATRFKKSFKRIPISVKKSFAERIEFFKGHPFHPYLKTYKLSGNLSNYYSFYLCDGFRVLFDFVSDNAALLINIGSHDDYKNGAENKSLRITNQL